MLSLEDIPLDDDSYERLLCMIGSITEKKRKCTKNDSGEETNSRMLLGHFQKWARCMLF